MARMVGQDIKDKDEAIAYTLDWSADVNSSTIDTSSWTVPSGLTNESTSIGSSALTTSIRLSGGTPGQVYVIENTVTLLSGEDLQASFKVTVQN